MKSYGASFEVFLDGVENFDGSTNTTGLNYGLYDGPHRAECGAALVYFENRWTHGLRLEPGRMRQTLPLVIVTQTDVAFRSWRRIGSPASAPAPG